MPIFHNFVLMEEKKLHWEKVYDTKQPSEVSWTQEVPQVSLDLIAGLDISKNTKLIDVGGGDSNLVDHLIKLGYTDITVLDISANAIERAKARLGTDALKVNWIVSDILEFSPEERYEIWHDRATFHFLTDKEDIQTYVSLISSNVDGHLLMGTFSENGPKKCSGLNISQYNEEKLSMLFAENFEKMGCKFHNHVTPFGTTQNFLFCSFRSI